MNFFGSDNTGPSALTVAKVEAETLTDMFNKMAASCQKKCIIRQNEADLQVGEMACIDRCVGKYMQAQQSIGEVLQKFEAQMKAQEASGITNYSLKQPQP